MAGKAYKWTSIAYMVLIFLMLYAPIFVLIAYSFNESELNIVWTGFTFKWYGSLVKNQEIIDAFKNSLILALLSTIISAMVGTLAAVGMYKYNFRGKSVLDGLLYIPVVIPEIVMGIALLAFFSMLRLPLGLLSLVLSHAAFCIPFVVVVVRARLEGFDRSIEEAAADLGASPWKTFFKVTLPIIMPGIVSGALLAFTLSIDDLIISFFVSGPKSTTLPMKIFGMVKYGVTPEINALSTIMLVVTLSIVIVAQSIRLKKSS